MSQDFFKAMAANLMPGDVAINEGELMIYGEAFIGAGVVGMHPIRKAVVVARLRALADEIEKAETL